MTKSRPKPDELLAQVQEEERQQKKGKLKIFFGAAPGVGKTFSMLSEALIKRNTGLDVVTGIVETHGRKEIQDLAEKFETLPRYTIEYRGNQLKEFNLDSAIKRHPALILIDEMAHTNIAGARHTKRWQDIEELLDRGIDVYTTLNVQHIESLNDVIKQITGITVKETVPDSILEIADSIELVDLPPDDLLKRLQEGKVYVPEQAELAIHHFFRKANLTALRELALRFTAERVNVQVQSQRRDAAAQQIWPTSERLLVCIDQKPLSIKLIRTAKRMATNFQAEWLVIFVDTPRLKTNEEQRQTAIQNLRFAEQMGAETAILSGSDIVKEIIDFAQSNNITKIIIGKEVKARWKSYFTRSLSDELLRASKEIDVYIVTSEKQNLPTAPIAFTPKPYIFPWFEYLLAVLVTGFSTLISFVVYPYTKSPSLAMIYLVGAVYIAARGRFGPAILASILGALSYDFFFVPPQFEFSFTDPQYLIALAVMLLVTQIISHLTIINKKQSEIARMQERRTSTLYHLSRELASHRGTDQLLQIAAKHITEVFDSSVLILLPSARGHLVAHDSQGEISELDTKERSIAQWAYDMGQSAGLGTSTLPSTKALYYPLQGSSNKIGVLRIQPKNIESLTTPEQMHLLETLIRQATLSVEIDKLQEEVSKTQLEIETKALRSILLSAISRELQIPLSDIQKALRNLIEDLHKSNMDQPAENIQKYLYQLNQLSEHLVQTLQLEAGIIELRKELHAIEKIIHPAMTKLEKILLSKPVFIHIQNNIPAIPCDKILLKRVFVNLIENAAKYTPFQTPIEIAVTMKDKVMEVKISDQGKGIAAEDIERVFEKFYRGQIPPKTIGSGLGLFICRSIVELHGGKIWVEPREGGGAIFKFILPAE